MSTELFLTSSTRDISGCRDHRRPGGSTDTSLCAPRHWGRRGNRCDLLRQTWKSAAVSIHHKWDCIMLTLLQTNTPEAWFRGDRRGGRRDGCSFSWRQRRMSQTCRGTWTCRTARPCSGPWGPRGGWSSRWVDRSTCSRQSRKIYGVMKPLNKCLSYHFNIVILPALGEAPKTKHGLEQVVSNDDVLDVIRLPVLHKPAIKIGVINQGWFHNWN